MNDKKNETQPVGSPIALIKESAVVFQYLRPYLGYIILGTLLLFVSSLAILLMPYLSGLMIDIALGEAGPSISFGKIGWILLGLFIVQILVSYFNVYFFAVAAEKGMADLRKGLFKKLLYQPIMYFDKNKAAELVSRLTGDVSKLYEAFSSMIGGFIQQLTLLILGSLFILFKTPKLSLIMLAIPTWC